MAKRSNDAGSARGKAAALAAAVKLPEPPAGARLTARERRVWDGLMRSQKIELWSAALLDTAVRTVKASTQLRQFDALIAETGLTVTAQAGQFAGLQVPNPMLKQQEALERKIINMLRSMGLARYASVGARQDRDTSAKNQLQAHGAFAELAPLAELLGFGGARSN